MKTNSISSIASIFYLVILFSIPFLFSSCELNDDRIGGFPPEGQIWAEIESTNYTFSEPIAPIPSLLNTYSERVRSLFISRSTNSNTVVRSDFRVTLTVYNFDDTMPRILENTNIRFEFSQGNTAFIQKGGDIRFEILSIENDVIKANFSGTLTNRDNPSQQLRVRNGALHIKIRRE